MAHGAKVALACRENEVLPVVDVSKALDIPSAPDPDKYNIAPLRAEDVLSMRRVVSPEPTRVVALRGSASRDRVDIARALLFRQSKNFAGILGSPSAHPLLPEGIIHPSTSDAYKSVIGRLCAGKTIHIEQPKKLIVQKIQHSGLIFGGPVSTLESRLLFGTGEVSPLLGIELPVTFKWFDVVGNSRNSAKELWQLIINGIDIPVVASKDYLTLTSLPLDNSDRLFYIVGLRGAGTRAIDLLLTNTERLEQLVRDTRIYDGWQAVEVSVKLDDTETPVALGDMKVFNVDYDFGKIENLLRNRIILSQSERQALIDIIPGQHSRIHKLPEHLHKKSFFYTLKREKAPATPDRPNPLDLGRDPVNTVSGRPVRHSRDEVAYRPSGLKDEMGNLERELNVVLLDARQKVSVKKDQSEIIRPGRQGNESAKLRRLDVLLSERDFERIEKLRDLTDARTVTDVIRDSLRVYEEVAEAVMSGKRPIG
jgi:hypothetical protein